MSRTRTVALAIILGALGSMAWSLRQDPSSAGTPHSPSPPPAPESLASPRFLRKPDPIVQELQARVRSVATLPATTAGGPELFHQVVQTIGDPRFRLVEDDTWIDLGDVGVTALGLSRPPADLFDPAVATPEAPFREFVRTGLAARLRMMHRLEAPEDQGPARLEFAVAVQDAAERLATAEPDWSRTSKGTVTLLTSMQDASQEVQLAMKGPLAPDLRTPLNQVRRRSSTGIVRLVKQRGEALCPPGPRTGPRLSMARWLVDAGAHLVDERRLSKGEIDEIRELMREALPCYDLAGSPAELRQVLEQTLWMLELQAPR